MKGYNMNCPNLRILKLFDDAKLPVRANPTDSGADVFIYRFEWYSFKPSINDQSFIELLPGDRVLINTGLVATVGPGYEIQIRPRSGNALKRGLTVLNTPGTIDESYRGMLGVIIINLSSIQQRLNVGDKIAQIVVQPVILSEIIEVESLNETDRGVSGFGDSGK